MNFLVSIKAFILISILILCLSGCGNKDANIKEDSDLLFDKITNLSDIDNNPIDIQEEINIESTEKNNVEEIYYNENTKNRIGNTFSNITNGGYVTEQSDYMYYCNQNEDKPIIFREKLDGTDKIALVNFHGSSLNVVGDYLYYVNNSDNNKIYQTKIDGSNTVVISTDTYAYLQVYNNELYARQSGTKNALVKMDLEGNDERILSNELIDLFTICDDIIVCITTSKNVNYGGRKILLYNLDGTLIKDLQITTYNILGIVDDDLYYIDMEDEVCKKINVDTEVKVTISGKNKIQSINIKDNILYLSNYSDSKIYTYDLNTNLFEPFVVNGNTTRLNIVGEWLYFWEYTGGREPSGMLSKDIKRISLSTLNIQNVDK
ncbi:MAG TPA: hypothetical protein DHW61_08455 [Lachnoclostridium phytofermentans]|uniref:Prolow-density lipoprotein receptor-related protein 1-like beta-propeller domain-containing protein n=1 Tax=Lachnoclostridium phytofermentans TaxID=66219 RepID=A0A3D2X5P6_9FIRM|nr:hypothetical protein [Lachnoclostridium phytofermentans]